MKLASKGSSKIKGWIEASDPERLFERFESFLQSHGRKLPTIVLRIRSVATKYSSIIRSGILLFCGSLTMFSGGLIAPTLPEMREYFQNEPGADFLVSLIFSFHAVAVAVSAPVIGKLSDTFGRKFLLILSLLMFSVAGSSPAFLSNLYLILISRGFFGVGVGGIVTLVVALIADLFEPRARIRFMGIYLAFIQVVGVFLFPLAGIMADVTWRLPFVCHTLGFLPIPLIIFYIPQENPKSRSSSSNLSPFKKSLELTDVSRDAIEGGKESEPVVVAEVLGHDLSDVREDVLLAREAEHDGKIISRLDAPDEREFGVVSKCDRPIDEGVSVEKDEAPDVSVEKVVGKDGESSEVLVSRVVLNVIERNASEDAVNLSETVSAQTVVVDEFDAVAASQSEHVEQRDLPLFALLPRHFALLYTGFFYNVAFYIVPAMIPGYVTRMIIPGASNLIGGLVLAVMVLSGLLASLSYPRLSRVLSRSHMIVLCTMWSFMGLTIAGLTSFWIGINSWIALVLSLIAVAILGLANGLFFPNELMWCVHRAKPNWRGTLSGQITTANFLGQFVGPVVAQVFVSLVGSSHTFLVFALISFAMLYVPWTTFSLCELATILLGKP